MSVSFESNMPLIKTRSKMANTIVVRQMLEDAWMFANPVTPMKDGHLRSAVERRMISPTSGYIEWKAPYASYQDRGMRADGSRVITHHTTPGTHERFASEAVTKVMARLPYYANLQGQLV